MRFSVTSLLVATYASAASCSPSPSPPPKNWAVALFDSFDIMDIVGPLNPLWYAAFSRQLNLALIHDTLDPVWIQPVGEELNTQNSSFWFSINPTHTYDNPPEDIDVLLVPGGPGARLGDVSRVIDFVRETYPKVQYLITTCTGSGIAARAGVLDGKRATTNKKAWNAVVEMGPNVDWVSPARWTVDGNIWTSSGITSGLDLIFAFMEEVYGADLALSVQGTTEHDRRLDPCDDPFAEMHGAEPRGDCSLSASN